MQQQLGSYRATHGQQLPQEGWPTSFRRIQGQRYLIPVSWGANGFGLIEVLLAAGILSLITGAVVLLTVSSVKTAILGADRTVGYQLAQEGVELVRQLRDSTAVDTAANRWNQLPGLDDTAIPSDCSTSSGCQLEGGTNGSWKLTPGLESIPVVVGAASSGSPPTTIFTRKIQLRSICWYTADSTTPSDCPSGQTAVPNNPLDQPSGSQTLIMQVVSTVSWNEQSHPISVIASTFLSDWRVVQ